MKTFEGSAEDMRLDRAAAKKAGKTLSQFEGSAADERMDRAGQARMNKGARSGVGHFAAGGPVLGRSENWMKSPDRFRTSGGGKDIRNVVEQTEDQYPKGKGASPAKRSGDTKALTAVKPRT